MRLIAINKNRPAHIVLGVDPSADQETIRRAYRKLSLEYHPDRNRSPDAEERMKEINAAYDIMKKGGYYYSSSGPSSSSWWSSGSRSSSSSSSSSSSGASGTGSSSRERERSYRNRQRGRRRSTRNTNANVCPICQTDFSGFKYCTNCLRKESKFDIDDWHVNDKDNLIKWYNSLKVRAWVAQKNKKDPADGYVAGTTVSKYATEIITDKFSKFRVRRDFNTQEEAAEHLHDIIIEFGNDNAKI